jgi:hypothetical protein
MAIRGSVSEGIMMGPDACRSLQFSVLCFSFTDPDEERELREREKEKKKSGGLLRAI